MMWLWKPKHALRHILTLSLTQYKRKTARHLESYEKFQVKIVNNHGFGDVLVLSSKL